MLYRMGGAPDKRGVTHLLTVRERDETVSYKTEMMIESFHSFLHKLLNCGVAVSKFHIVMVLGCRRR